MKWKNFKGETLPQNCLDFFRESEIWKYGANWIIAFYFGESPETATRWAIVLDDGGFYKVDAIFAFWHPYKDGVSLKCQWSLAALHRSITAMKKGLPGYTT
jgi:hypothetical protein